MILDQRLVEFLGLGKFGAAADRKFCPIPSLTARAREAAEEAKIRLSTDEEVEIRLPFLTPSFSF